MTIWVALLCTPWIISWDTQLSSRWLHLCQILANLHVDLSIEAISWFVCTSMVARYAYSRMMSFSLQFIVFWNSTLAKARSSRLYHRFRNTHSCGCWLLDSQECTASFMLDQWQEFSGVFYSLDFCVSVIFWLFWCIENSPNLKWYAGILFVCIQIFLMVGWHKSRPDVGHSAILHPTPYICPSPWQVLRDQLKCQPSTFK